MIQKMLQRFGYVKLPFHELQLLGRNRKPVRKPLLPTFVYSYDDRLAAETVAFHEVGHLMVYMAINTLPEDLTVYIFKDKGGLIQGSVNGSTILNNIVIQSMEFFEWKMLIALGGIAAEINRNRSHSIGCTADLENWLNFAIPYCKSFARGVFYSAPVNELELNHNEQKLQSLKQQQLMFVRKFLSDNKVVHEEITQILLNNSYLTIKDIEVFKSRIKYPSNFPLSRI